MSDTVFENELKYKKKTHFLQFIKIVELFI